MMLEICKQNLIDALKNSDTYVRYEHSRTLLLEQGDVLKEIMTIRKETMELYSTQRDDLLERTEELARRMDRLVHLPGVNAFLQSEEELFRILREIGKDLINSLSLTTPESEYFTAGEQSAAN